jgi:hypothetical protein
MSKSYRVEVQADAGGAWSGNALRFAEEQEAEAYARDLWGRWSAVRAYRVSPVEDRPTHQWDGDRAVPIVVEGARPVLRVIQGGKAEERVW